MWRTFNEMKPKLGQKVITRSPGYEHKGNCFEDWREWKINIQSYKPPPSHWWSGEFDFDLAINSWIKQET